MKTTPLLTLCLLTALPSTHAGNLLLASNGQSSTVILADPAVLAPDRPGRLPTPETEQENQRRRLRNSILDLSRCLELISGAPFPVVSNPSPAELEGRLIIRVGTPAAAVFGTVGISAPFQQAFRFVADPQKGIGLYGESDLASSYAVYELLDRLDARWFMPGPMGEVLPHRDPLAIPPTDEQLAPYTTYRGIWYADEAFKRRNRLGGLLLAAGHALEHAYLTNDQLAQHPDWIAQYADGRPIPGRFKWNNKALANAIAARINELQEKNPRPSWSLSPDDGIQFDESPEDRALDAGDFDPSCQTNSITDRFLVLANRIAEQVSARHPELLLGFLAYANYTRPPIREPVHPILVPQIAPITYSRVHPMNLEEVPNNADLRAIVEGWAKKVQQTSFYFYAFNLADTLSPCPMLQKWAHDVPFIYEKGKCRFWQPETIPNFETFLHAQYLGIRLAWNPKQNPNAIYDEVNRLFYGTASHEMAAYWDYVDRVWVETPEYSGCGYGHLRRWTPERIQKARALLDAARAAAQTEAEKFRVNLAHESFTLFESYMSWRTDLAEGRWAGLGDRFDAWLEQVKRLAEEYQPYYAFGKVGWTPHTIGGGYARNFFGFTLKEAQQIQETADRIFPTPPLRRFRYQVDKNQIGETEGWHTPEWNDRDWKETDVAMETWSSIGLHGYMGTVWYRATIPAPALPEASPVRLWIGATDGSARVFLNGQRLDCLQTAKTAQGIEQTVRKEEGTGYARPLLFDATAAVRPGALNQLAIRCTRLSINELGTGGLLAPVAIVQKRTP